MRDGVERDAVLERLDGQLVLGLAVQELARLIVQLGHGRGAGAGRGLVRGDDHAGDARQVVERLERNHHLDGGAVRIGDDAVMPAHVTGVHLGHHQRHVLVHAERAGVVDHDGAMGDHGLAHGLRHGAAGGEQRDVDALERFGRHLLHGQLACGNLAAALERQLLTGGTRGSQRDDLRCGEIQVVQHIQELVADGARSAANRNHRVSRHNFRPSHEVLLVHVPG